MQSISGERLIKPTRRLSACDCQLPDGALSEEAGTLLVQAGAITANIEDDAKREMKLKAQRLRCLWPVARCQRRQECSWCKQVRSQPHRPRHNS